MPPACAQLTGGALVTAQVEHVHVVGFVDGGLVKAVGDVAVDVAAVGEVTHHPAAGVALSPVGGPPDRTNVEVVERFLVGSARAGRVRVADRGVQGGVLEAGVVDVTGGLSHRIGRVAEDHEDVEGVLLQGSALLPVGGSGLGQLGQQVLAPQRGGGHASDPSETMRAARVRAQERSAWPSPSGDESGGLPDLAVVRCERVDGGVGVEPARVGRHEQPYAGPG